LIDAIVFRKSSENTLRNGKVFQDRSMNPKYNLSPISYQRFPTREVKVGGVGIGGSNPIRVQSMTTSDTQDTVETVRQILALEEVGCEIVRLTVPSIRDAENLPNIRNALKEKGSKVPIVADIHFTPSVALQVVENVEKVRINPGNFADKKKFAVIEYTEREYSEELERISELFLPLVRRCKELGVAMRIGTNHGSLSDRIMNRFGDTALGMVESAIEFIRMARSESFHDIVVSMKASNPQVMVSAYRLLISRFLELGMNYPIHLGVTEAGDGKDGRIKSSMGIGSLLEDGIGDTIRVSLTEDSVYEIPVAKRLVEKYNQYIKNQTTSKQNFFIGNWCEFRNPYSYTRFYSNPVPVGNLRLGENYPVRVETCFSLDSIKEFTQKKILEFVNVEGYVKPEILHFEPKTKIEYKQILSIKKSLGDLIPFSVDLRDQDLEFLDFPETLQAIEKLTLPFKIFKSSKQSLFSFLKEWNQKSDKTLEIILSTQEGNEIESFLEQLQKEKVTGVIFSLNTENFIYDYRTLGFLLSHSEFPILLYGEYSSSDQALYDASVGMGSLLLDGIGDVIRIKSEELNPVESLQLSFDILQAARLRTIKTEYISCPSCGRTLFNLQDTTARIKSKTGHLKGLKIAIMGCIVNGPGEMADADFGYVGAGPGKVHLYKGKEIVMKSIPSEIADEKLIELIQQEGRWVDP
jgi:(E)-4-hydroxy-3-methylbut-2-enyl-diphosphate synthase